MDDAHFINDLDHLSAVGLAPDMHMDSTAMSTQDLINEQAYSGLDTGDFLGTFPPRLVYCSILIC